MKPEQRVKKLAEIEKLRTGGVSTVEAAKRVGVTTTTYYTWRRGPKKASRAKAPVTIEVPAAVRASQVALLLGSPHDISATLQALRAGGAL